MQRDAPCSVTMVFNRELNSFQMLETDIDPEPYSDHHLLHLLFAASKQGVLVWRALYNKQNEPVDFKLVFVNDAARVSAKESWRVGKKMSRLSAFGKDLSPYLEVIHTLESYEGKITRGRKSLPFQAISLQKNLLVLCFLDEAEQQKSPDFTQGIELILDTIPDIVSRWDEEGRLLFANIEMANKTGVSNEQLYGKTKMEMGMPLDNAIPWTDKVKQVFKTGAPAEHYNYLLGAGKKIDLYSRLVPERNAEGQIVSVLAISRDITDIKKIEQELQAKNKSLEDAQKLGQIGDFYFDLWNENVVWSNELYYLMGVEPGKPMNFEEAVSFYVEKDKNELIRLVNQSFETGKGFEKIAEFIPRGQQQSQNLYIKAEIEKDEKGNHLGVRGVVMLCNFDEETFVPRKNEKDGLRDVRNLLYKSQQKYKVLFNSIDEGFCIIELMFGERGEIKDMYFREINEAFTKHTGLHDVIDKTVAELLPDFESYWMDIYTNVFNTGKPVREESYLPTVDRWYSNHFIRMEDNTGTFVAIVFDDITERKRIERNQAILTEVSKDLVELDNVTGAIEHLGEKIATHFGVAWCMFAELTDDLETAVAYGWHGEGVPSLNGTYRIRELWAPEQLAKIGAGETIVVNDAQIHSRPYAAIYAKLGIASYLSVPISREGNFRFLYIIMDTKPRQWRVDEVELMEELVSRIGTRLERVRAEEALKEFNIRLEQQVSDRTTELRANKELLQSIMDVSPTSILYGKAIRNTQETIEDFDFVAINEKWTQGTQVLMAELHANKQLSTKNTELFERYVKAVELNTPQDFEIHHTHEGENNWYRIVVVKLGDGIMLSAENITERKLAEQAIQNQSDILEAVYNAALTGLQIFKSIRNANGAIVDFEWTYATKIIEDFVGLGPLVGRRLLELVDADGWLEKYKTVIETGITAKLEQSFEYNKENHWFDVFVIKHGDGLVLAMEDIPKRKKAEAALHEHVNLLTEAERLAHMGSWEWNLSKNQMKWSDELYKIYQAEKDDLGITYQDFRKYVHPDDRSLLDAKINKALSDLTPFHSVYRIRVKGKSIRYLKSTAVVMSNEEGTPTAMTGIVQDITEQYRMKEETEKAVEEKQSAIEALYFKQQFLSNMSHEIRTPLTAIIGFTEEVMKTSLDSTQLQYLNAIKISGDSLLLLVNDVLDLAKVDAGKMKFDEQPFYLDTCISNMLLLFETKIQQKKLTLVENYDSRIPTVLLGDSARLNQIILNLVSNAVKFTQTGTITVDVILKEETEDEVIIDFSITDTGIGIQSHYLDKIFESFQQSESFTARVYGGTGLGLSIVKQLTEAQGGNVFVESTLGRGSSFTVRMPFKKAKSKQAVRIAESINNGEPRYIGDKKIQVLVAEDVELNQFLMTVVLSNMGLIPDIASNGKEAVEKLRKKKYDIVLMDLHMPIMNGFEATEIIRQEVDAQLPIIALTADVTSTDVKRIKSCGINDYITKPIDQEKLYRKIVEYVL